MSTNINQLRDKLGKPGLAFIKNDDLLVRVLNVIAILLLASMLASWTWQLLEPANNMVSTSLQKPLTSLQQADVARLSSVSGTNLFGAADALPVADNSPIVAPETNLRLKLVGVFASDDPERAYAIISESNQDKAYKLGSSIKGNIILHAVYPDKVILKRNGRLETLRLEKSKLDNNQVRPLTNTAENNPVTQNIASHAKLRQLKQTILKNPQTLWNQVRINPVLANGAIKGYTVEHNDKQIMDILTLQKGDVITAVEGKPLSDPASLYGLTKDLSSKSSINITIERNGQVQDIQVQL